MKETKMTTYTFTTIDVPGSTSAIARSINTSGQIVGVYYDDGIHGFLASPVTAPVMLDAVPSKQLLL
jgi:hypothetical protein